MDDGLTHLSAASLAPLFRQPPRLGTESAWWGHIPFAQWLIANGRPGVLVELGAYRGVSYAAFCDAVVRERTGTRCYAIDTWHGDEHNGFYDDSVFNDLTEFNQTHFANFSTLIRGTFDQALDRFADGSIDLLHIDGRHRYDDVLHDFTTWRPKLSDRAVVLFHDTNEYQTDFGVWQLWAEITQSAPHFSFLHSHGLGVLAIGPNCPQPILDFCAHPESKILRDRFATLGERWVAEFERGHFQRESATIAREAADRAAFFDEKLAFTESQRDFFSKQSTSLNLDLENLRTELGATISHLHDINDQANAFRDKYYETDHQLYLHSSRLHETLGLLNETYGKLNAAYGELNNTRDELAAVLNSTTWRIGQRAISLAARVPRPIRRLLRRLRRHPAAPLPTAPREAPAAPAPDIALASQADPEPTAQSELEPVPVPEAMAEPSVAASGKNILFVSGEPHTPGHQYRIARALESAAKLGWHAQCLPAADITPETLASTAMLLIWRATWSPDLERIFATCATTGTATIFDVDDLMFRPELARPEYIDGIRTQGLNPFDVQGFYARIAKAVRAADFCSATTAELAGHFRILKKPTFLLPNCWDETIYARARHAARARRAAPQDGLLRLGYAAGTRTHQKDFAQAAAGVASVLRQLPQARLVLFHDPAYDQQLLDPAEFPELAEFQHQIEWRAKVAIEALPDELARFDINLAPLEAGNPYCEAKSELKIWEAGLVDVPSVASPGGPFSRAMADGTTGLLANSPQEWESALLKLANDPGMRANMGHAAQRRALWQFGPLRHRACLASMLDQVLGGPPAARAMQLDLLAAPHIPAPPHLPARAILFEQDRLGDAQVTVIVPLYNYAHFVLETLASIAAQTAENIDLVIVEDRSTDNSLTIALDWARQNAPRFNRVVVAQHATNAGLAFARNTGFDLAETLYVLPVDADNLLRPAAAERLLSTLRNSGACFAYPIIQRFGTDDHLIGEPSFSAAKLASGNYIDAMALVRRDAWALAGGYDHVRFGWEDYDFWCRLVEVGQWGQQVSEILADYRAHENSMLHTQTDIRLNKIDLMIDMRRRHPWLDPTSLAL